MKKKVLSPEHAREADTLKAIFELKKKELGVTHEVVAAELDISQGAVSHYLNGKNPLNVRAASVFAKLLKIDISQFSPRLQKEIESLAMAVDPLAIKEPGLKYTAENDSVFAPIPFGSTPLRATIDGCEVQFEEDEELGPLFYRRDWIASKGFRVEALVVRKIKGSSMEPSLWDGDTVLINTDSRTPKNGRVFWVAVEGNACAKRLVRNEKGVWWIVSDNKAHEKTDQPLQSLEQILGEVVEKRSGQI
jgi:predicted transcriptional regulator